MDVWLASRSSNNMLGIFSSPEKAKAACQDVASEYLGVAHTAPLNWQGNEDFSSSTHHHPIDGMYVFMVTRFSLDEVSGSLLAALGFSAAC